MSSLRDASIIPSDAGDMLLPDQPASYGPGMNHAFRRIPAQVQMTNSNFPTAVHNFEFKTDTSVLWRPRDSYFECKFKVRVKSRTNIPNIVNADYSKAWTTYINTVLTAWKAKLDIVPGSNTGEFKVDGCPN